MNITHHRFLIGLVGLSLGCGSVVATSNPDAGTAPVDVGQGTDRELPVDTSLVLPRSCPLPRGGTCPAGQTCPAGDNCNTCHCPAFGEFAACTANPCVAPGDGGTLDAGPGGCRTASDCGPSRQCNFSAAGCGLPGVCGFLTDCASVQQYCSCTGESFADCPGSPTRPWVARGACASDGGTAVDVAPRTDVQNCAGASLGRGGGYCAGPADGPLPVTCCTDWNCDQRLVACNRIPPTCPAGEVAAVAGGCYGPCVPATHCAPVRCEGGCAAPWVCDPSTSLCRYPR